MGNVLIIDDDQTIRDALARVVTRLGHEAIEAPTLTEGLRRAAREDVDVVFLDVRMNGAMSPRSELRARLASTSSAF